MKILDWKKELKKNKEEVMSSKFCLDEMEDISFGNFKMMEGLSNTMKMKDKKHSVVSFL